MFNRSPIGAALALALLSGVAALSAPDHRMGHGRVRPGQFPGITFEAQDDKVPAAPLNLEAKTLAEAKTLFVQLRDAIDAVGDATQEQKNNMAALQEQLSKLELDVKGNRPTPGASKGEAEHDQETKSFLKYARRGEKGMSAEEVKTLTTDSDSDGGYLVPTNIDRTIREKLILISPIRELAEVITISQGDTMEIPVEDDNADFGAGWVAERGSRGETSSGKVNMVKITAHEMYANPFISQKLLDDNAYNVEGWINDRVARRMAKVEGSAFVSGDGVGKPLGFLNTASGVPEVVSGHATLLTADGFLAIFYDLPEEYAHNATWTMKRATIGAARMLKDGQGQYLWQPGLQADQPGVLLGRPYRETVDMPTVAASAYPVAFGDFRTAYAVVDRQGVRMLRDPFSAKPFVEFYTTKRTGGAVVQKQALRKLKIST